MTCPPLVFIANQIEMPIHPPSSRKQVVAGLFACKEDLPTLERQHEQQARKKDTLPGAPGGEGGI